MTLLSIIISLLVERFLGTMEELRGCRWFSAYVVRLRSGALAAPRWDGALGVVTLLAGPLLLLSLTLSLVDELWLLYFLFAIMVLLFSFGPRDLEAEVEALLDAWERNDGEAAQWYIDDLLEGREAQPGLPLGKALVEAVLVAVNERYLAVIFWFLVLGPFGAVLYRLSAVLVESSRGDDSGFAAATRRLHEIIGLPPTYLCAFTYALAGSFVDAITALRTSVGHLEGNLRKVLIDSGLGAMCYPRHEENAAKADNPPMVLVSEVMSLVRRAMMVALALIAALTLAGWGG